jgi:hypothetical protein
MAIPRKEQIDDENAGFYTFDSCRYELNHD